MALLPLLGRRSEGIERLYGSSGGFGKLLGTSADRASRENTERSFELLARFVAPRFNGSPRSLDSSRDWVMSRRGPAARSRPSVGPDEHADATLDDRVDRGIVQVHPAQHRGQLGLADRLCRARFGDSVLKAGLMLAPQGVGYVIAVVVAGRATDRLSPGSLALVGVVLTLIGTVPFVMLDSGSGWLLPAAAMTVRGIGVGVVTLPSLAAAYRSLPPAAMPRASSAMNIFQRLGGSIGTAVVATVLQQGLTGGRPHGASVNDAFRQSFWWAVAFTAVTLVPVLLLPRKPPALAPAHRPPVAGREAASAGR
ncbi:MFS transporter [Streptomyces sp. NPDC007164]|uniref:MFS transporter n=1 Tax=Streptomyces sp. NPDC007164 TaxID=3156918 RepID=UPI00340E6AA7